MRTGSEARVFAVPWEDTHETGRGLSQTPDHAGTLISAFRAVVSIVEGTQPMDFHYSALG